MGLSIGSRGVTALAVICLVLAGGGPAAAKRHAAVKTEKAAPIPTPAAPVPILAPAGDMPKGKIVLDVTPIPGMTGGGPTLAIDPSHSQTMLQVTELAPAKENTAARDSTFSRKCAVSISLDGGFTWNSAGSLPIGHAPGSVVTKPKADCRSPALTAGPDGSFYAVMRSQTALGHPNAGRAAEIDFLESDDAGKGWSAPIHPFADADLPGLKARGFNPPASPADLADRPELRFDSSRAALYVSAGGHPQRYITVTTDGAATWRPAETPDCDEQTGGQVECWQYPAVTDAATDAANGVLAALYGSGPPLKKTASQQGSCDRPCWIFATSIDFGQHWRRVRLPPRLAGAPGAVTPSAGYLAADPSHRGAFAIMLLRPQESSLQLAVTANGGASWSSSYVLGEDAATRTIGRPAIAYSPLGIIGVVWRGANRPKGSKKSELGSAQDVYSAISRDGGRSFSAPLRVNAIPPAEGRPWPGAAPAGADAPVSLTIDAQYLYLAWDQYDDSQPHNLSHGWFARIPLRDFEG